MYDITIVNRHATEEGILVARPHPLGNPYTHYQGRTTAQYVVESRDAAVAAYRKWLWQQVQLHTPQRQAIAELARLAKQGPLVLACWCAPRNCHAFVVRNAILWWLKVEQGAHMAEASALPPHITIQSVEKEDDGVHVRLGGHVDEDHGWSAVELVSICTMAGYTARMIDNTLVIGYEGEDYFIRPAGLFRRLEHPMIGIIAVIADIREGRWPADLHATHGLTHA